MSKNENSIIAKKTRRYEIRFTENEWNKLQALAEDFEMSVAEFIRWSVFQRSVTMRILIDGETRELSKIKYQLDRIGNNINQIVKLLNTGFVNPEMFRTELKDMFRIIHGEICLLNEVQSSIDSRWRKGISKYSRDYLIDKTELEKKWSQ